MATTKNDTDTNTRTITDSAVNTDATSVLNKSENDSVNNGIKQSAEIVHRISAANSSQEEDDAKKSTGFVSTGTNSSDQDREQRALTLLEEARKATVKFDRQESEEKDRRSDYKAASAIASRDLIKNMLRVVESFKDDKGTLDKRALEDFLKKHVGDKHASEKAEFFRISKYCSTSETPKVMTSKRAYALDTIVERGISSDNLDDVFDVEENNIGPDKVTRSGMQKYILLFQDKHGLLKSSKDKYRNMKDEAFFKLAREIISEIRQRTSLPDELIADVLAEIGEET